MLARFRFALWTVVCSCSFPVLAQLPAPLQNPNIDLYAAGVVTALARLPDGSMVVGGRFTSVFDPASGLSFERRNLAKFNPGGGLDLAWDPPTDGTVYALAPDGAGSVFVGGSFSTIAGLERAGVAKLATTGAGAASATWDAACTCSTVFELTLTASGAVYVGGAFESIGGAQRTNIARLSGSTGSAEPGWDPSANSTVLDIDIGPDGLVYVTGYFTSIGGQNRTSIARLEPAGTGSADPAWNPAPVGTAYLVEFSPAGALYVGGEFSAIGGLARTGIARLSSTGTGAADPGWNPGAVGYVVEIKFDSSGNLYTGGGFSAIGGQQRSGFARLATTGAGAADPAFDIPINGFVATLGIDASGGIYVGGEFDIRDDPRALGIARINASGVRLLTQFIQDTATVYDMVRAADGSLFVAGSFKRADAESRNGLLKLSPEGTLDLLWNPDPDSYVSALAVDVNGSVFAGGSFASIGRQTRFRVAKLQPFGNGDAVVEWNPAVFPAVEELALDPSGTSLYIGGSISSVNGVARNNIAKLSATGTGVLDAVWNPDASNSVFAIAVAADGDVYVGGVFTSVGGAPRSRVAKLSGGGTGSAIAAWDASASAQVLALGLDSDGTIVAAGDFSSIGGLVREGIARLSPASGAADPAWNPLANGLVRDFAFSQRGDLLITGAFTSIGGLPRPGLAKIDARNSGNADPQWNPGQIGTASAVEPGPGDSIYFGGSFVSIGSQPRKAIAALPATIDPIFSDGFEN